MNVFPFEDVHKWMFCQIFWGHFQQICPKKYINAHTQTNCFEETAAYNIPDRAFLMWFAGRQLMGG